MGVMCSSCISQDGAGASGPNKWCDQPENWLSRCPYAVHVLSLLSFSWLGGGRIYDGRGAVVLLDCASDRGEVRLFHGVKDLDGAVGGIARCVYARLQRYVGLIIRRTAPFTEPRRTFLAQRELPLAEVKVICPPSRCR